MSKNSNTLNSDWRNITINQLSFTNNLILTLSTGFLIYCLDKITPNKVGNNSHQLFLIISINSNSFVIRAYLIALPPMSKTKYFIFN